MNEVFEQQQESIEEKRRRFFQHLGQKSIEIKRVRESEKPADFKDFYKKSRYEVQKEFPEFEKIIDVIFRLREFVNRNDNVNHHFESLVGEQKKKDIIEMCAWEHDATEILIEFGWNKELQDRFWREAGKFFDIFSQYRKDFEKVHQGTTGQARAFLILQELGYNPRLATPEEDYGGVDFHLSSTGRNEELIAQIKDWKKADKTVVDLVDIGSPGLVVDHTGGRQTRIQERRMAEISKLRGTCGDVSGTLGKQIRSLLIILSEKDFDFQTGRPKPGFVEKLKADLVDKLK